MKAISIPIQIVFYREGEFWIAHCLEFDLIGSGETHDEALESLTECIRIQMDVSFESKNMDNLFRPAESKYWQMFASGSPHAIGDVTIEFRTVKVEAMTAREYEEGLVCV